MSPQRLGIIAVVVTGALSALVAVSANTNPTTAAPTGDCQPELDPVWGVEAEPLRVPIVCGTGQLPAATDLELVGAPAGVELDPAELAIEWTPGLDQAATHEFAVRVGDEEASVVVGVGDAWDHPDNVPPIEPTRLTRESGLPVFHLVTDASIGTDRYRDARVTYQGHEYSGTAAKLRGSLSLGYDKDNFTIRFDASDPFSDPDLPGLDGSLKLVLNGNFDDNSHVRNRLAFELWNRMSPDHLRVDHTSAVVYVDGDYAGLYTVTDHIGAEFLAAAGLEDGELYKAVGHLADFTSESGSLADRDLEQKVPDPDDVVVAEPAVLDLYDFVDEAGSTEFSAEVADRVVLEEFIDWFVLVSLISAGDSTAKNVYVYAPADGSAIRALPWDFNHSFGQDFLTGRTSPEGLRRAEIAEDNRLFERFLADPELVAMVDDRMTDLLGGLASAEAVDDLLTRFGDEVRIAARRDEARWGPSYRETPAWADRSDFTTFDEELDYLGTWYDARVAVLASDLDASAS